MQHKLPSHPLILIDTQRVQVSYLAKLAQLPTSNESLGLLDPIVLGKAQKIMPTLAKILVSGSQQMALIVGFS